ncbi:MAG TPA: plasmid pRiA4b ORF-3 family protein [Spirochaetales bacterium]|nr:plasmid pRiA4b ORF-3 family protein [Spirochaetales bacterium]
MNNNATLRQHIREYILRSKKRFRLQELLDFLKSISPDIQNEKEVLDLLESERLVFSPDFDLFYPRHLFFKNAQFLISPTAEEVENGFLIPGHRFLPFISPLIKPWEATLTDNEGNRISTCKVRKRLKDLYIYFSLFSRLNEYNLANPELHSTDAEGMVELDAFDFASLFTRCKLIPGGGILVTVLNWAKGEYRIEAVSKRKRQSMLKNGTEWLNTLEQGFLKSFEDLGLKYPIEEQIAYAYFYAGKKILSNPPIHLGGFIESSSLIHFVDFGTEKRLWHSLHVPFEDMDFTLPSEPKGETGSIDKIFEDIGVSLKESSVEAYIRDALYHGADSPAEVLGRIFSGRETFFYSQEQVETFQKYFNNLWKRVKRSYNFFTDQHSGSLREQVLRLLDEHLAWLRDLDRRGVDPSDIPPEEAVYYGQLSAFLEGYLQLLNARNPGTEAELSEARSFLPQLDQTLQDIRKRIEDGLKEKDKSGSQHGKPAAKTAKKKNAKEASDTPEPSNTEPSKGQQSRKVKKIYILKVQLQYIRPPIWRRIQVPGWYTLEDLHAVIQVAMGWSNYHLHEFEIDGKEYGPEDREFYDNTIPEQSVTLDSLKLEPRKRIRYMYDFGDGWAHTLMVEKVLSLDEVPPERQSKPYCLTGKRACPPEDCGGYGGYEEILEALKSPNKKKYRELLEWVGSYDPELFDVEKVNQELSLFS